MKGRVRKGASFEIGFFSITMEKFDPELLDWLKSFPGRKFVSHGYYKNSGDWLIPNTSENLEKLQVAWRTRQVEGLELIIPVKGPRDPEKRQPGRNSMAALLSRYRSTRER